ncbi:MAG: YraN family protein [Actinomycetales bacterium]|nr:YraN family protein [Actinomycetales bacterium]
MAAKDELGLLGERLAERHLTRGGMELLDRNWRCSQGEIDLVLRDGDEIVFVEVKTRASVAFGHPLEAITPVKLARLRRLAGEWCAIRRAEGRAIGRIRIDAVGVVAPRHAPATVDHLAGVFR